MEEMFAAKKRLFKSIRFKVFAGLMVLQLISFGSLGYLLFEVAQKEYFKKFQNHLLSIARTAALGIDPARHSNYTEPKWSNDAEYRRYFRQLNNVHRSEKYVSYIYTLNYDHAADRLTYGVDGTSFDTDTLWFESDAVSFYFSMDRADRIVVFYNSQEFRDEFSISTPLGSVPVSVRQSGPERGITVNGQVTVRIQETGSLKARCQDKIIDRDNTEAHSNLRIGSRTFPVRITFSRRGQPATKPGEEFLDTMIPVIKSQITRNMDYVDAEIQKTSYGEVLYAMAMIRENTGAVRGVVVVEVYTREIEAYRRSMQTISAIVFILTLLVTISVSFFLGRSILVPIRVLTAGVSDLSNGNLEARVHLSRGDEFGRLADTFNEMVQKIKTATEETLSLNRELASTVNAYSRFVPHSFLNYLGVERIVDIALGDQVESEMSILFCDIRSFTTLSESMTPDDNFKFINGYLGRVGPIIRRNGGFIDKYIGDGIMALFPESAEDALRAAIEIQHEIFFYNSRRIGWGRAPIRVGVGIHTGKLIMGTIGESERMDGTVISDAVNSASRLEGLTKHFGTAIIISGRTREKLANPCYFHFRNIGSIRVKGKNEALPIYEVLDGLPAESLAKRMTSAEIFEKALSFYQNSRFAEAKELFSAIASGDPDDRAAAYYLSRISYIESYGIPPDWSGDETINEK